MNGLKMGDVDLKEVFGREVFENTDEGADDPGVCKNNDSAVVQFPGLVKPAGDPAVQIGHGFPSRRGSFPVGLHPAG